MTATCMSTVLTVDIQYPISHFTLFLFWGNYIFICIPSVDERSDRFRSCLISVISIGRRFSRCQCIRYSSVSSVSNISFEMADEDKPTFGSLPKNAMYGD